MTLGWAVWAICMVIGLSAWIVMGEIRNASDRICRHLDTLHQDYHEWKTGGR